MPTNVTPEYKAAEQRYREAETPEGQLEALQAMLSTVPKHKGTEKLQADIKRQISVLRRDAARQQKARGHRPAFIVDRAEGGQAVLVGPPNSGKSRLLSRLTNAAPEVADYPYSTQLPVPGMMAYENVLLQLVDLPPVARGMSEPWVFEAIKRADAVLLVIDAASDDCLADLDDLLALLEERHVRLVPPASDRPALAQRALVVANKVETVGSEANCTMLRELLGDRLPLVAVSAATGAGLEDLRRAVFDCLHVIRVYTKAPGRPGDRSRPFLLERGATVLDAARQVHHDFADALKFARIWGSERFEGQMVSRDHVLADEDMVEFHRG